MKGRFRQGDALLLLGAQNDYFDGGALAATGDEPLLTALNECIDAADRAGIPIVAVRDLHPPDHCHFVEHGGPWSAHCVRDTTGAAFHPRLRIPEGACIVTKGGRRDRAAESAFDDTGLANHLREHGVERLWIAGLARDASVRASVIDACDAGFETHLIAPATLPVSVDRGGGNRVLEAARAAGARIEEVPA